METLTAVVGASKAILSKHQIGQETYMQLTVIISNIIITIILESAIT